MQNMHYTALNIILAYNWNKRIFYNSIDYLKYYYLNNYTSKYLNFIFISENSIV